MKIDLIPALEISSVAVNWQLVGPRPSADYIVNPQEWERYQTRVLQVAGFAEYQRVIPGSNLLAIDDWTLPDLRKLIRAHLGSGNEEIIATDSCALFGGGVLFVDYSPVLVPQCCSTLADLYSWKTLLEPNFQSGYFCLEGHPCPKATKDNNTLWIFCQDEYESFDQPAQAEILLDLAALATAISAADKAVAGLCEKVDWLSAEFGVQKLSDHIIRGK